MATRAAEGFLALLDRHEAVRAERMAEIVRGLAAGRQKVTVKVPHAAFTRT